MLQRIQTIWLLTASVLSFLTLRLPVYNGNKIINDVQSYSSLSATSGLFLIILTVSTGLIAFITIFLYKNRNLQLKLCLAALLLCLITDWLFFAEIKLFGQGSFTLWSVLYFLIPISILLAMRGIYKDQKLVKSVDRLR